jgi:hypothetical protein
MFFIFSYENLAAYEVKTRRTRNACWVRNSTKHTIEFVIFIAFPLQQWLHEHHSMLPYTYIACLDTI